MGSPSHLALRYDAMETLMRLRNPSAGLIPAILPCLIAAALPTVGTVPGQAVPSGAAFEIDGTEYRFEHVSETDSFYSRLSSKLQAGSAADSTERLFITFLQVDLKQLDPPVDLPGERDFSNPADMTGPMASIGFGFIDSEGQEWAGPGTVHIEAFDSDGILQGTFDDVTLPHVDGELPDITLENGAFRGRITAPW